MEIINLVKISWHDAEGKPSVWKELLDAKKVNKQANFPFFTNERAK